VGMIMNHHIPLAEQKLASQVAVYSMELVHRVVKICASKSLFCYLENFRNLGICHCYLLLFSFDA
jgi:hypothetical protein